MSSSPIYSIVELFSREDTCATSNDYDGLHWGARISSVFVLLIASAFGSFFPVLSSRYSFLRLPVWFFFIAKFFGSGVIVATSFIHLLSPASGYLGEECLGYPFTDYPFAFAICLITLMTMFFAELIAYRFMENKIAQLGESDPHDSNHQQHSHSHFGDSNLFVKNSAMNNNPIEKPQQIPSSLPSSSEDIEMDVVSFQDKHTGIPALNNANVTIERHMHSNNNNTVITSPDDSESLTSLLTSSTKAVSSTASFMTQLMNVLILEFGIIFHSIFVGLTLAVSGSEFPTLYVVVVFHQLFEGLGLGSRIALVNWPIDKRATPWLLAAGYALCTPIAIAIGLGVRKSYVQGSRVSLITNGVFDSVSAGILVYTGLIELMAHEFLFGDEFKGPGGLNKMLWAYFVMCIGAGLMALLGRWA